MVRSFGGIKPLAILILALLGASQTAQAAQWTYRGSLNDGGKPANGSYDLRLTLTDAAGVRAIGQPLTLYGVAVKDGNFATDVDFGVDLTNAPALKLKTEVAQGGSGFVSLGEATRFDPKAALAGICWDTTGNVVAPGEFLGSTNAAAVEIKANNFRVSRYVNLGTAADWGDAPQVLQGSSANTATGIGATIGGGGAPRNGGGSLNPLFNQIANGNFSTISGGNGNRASGDYSAIGGGKANFAAGGSSVVAGGEGNRADFNFGTIGGGLTNTLFGNLATISGGTDNEAGVYGAVGGGILNMARGVASTVAGGDSNQATGSYSTVAGGKSNCAGGDYSWVGGRAAKTRRGNQAGDGTCVNSSNDADGDEGSFVWADTQPADFVSTGSSQFLIRAQGGVAINTATPLFGNALTVAGDAYLSGDLTTTGADVAGNIGFRSTTRQMLNLFGTSYGIGIQGARMYFRAAGTGGFNWFEGGVHSNTTDDPGAGGTLRMRLTAAGQLQTTTGTISSFSDARLKSDVGNYTNALDQIAALRPVHYRYTNAGKAPFQPEGTHLGFIAQEVQQVFPEWVSEDESGYLMLSMRGFEAVAVRGMQELQAENAALRARLDAIEAKLAAQQ